MVITALAATGIAAALGAFGVRPVHSQDHNFAGSVQTNYLWVASDRNAREHTFDGFTNEVSLKAALDFSPSVSANLKLCYGCHGLEVDMASVDLRAGDELNVRLGRFNPPFGDFPLRHDPANHRTSDKPLPYDMGRMLRLREYNLGVLPAPHVDQGLEVNGTHWFGDALKFDYAAYVVSGLQAGQDDIDLDFRARRIPYYVDNNSEPAVGGRIAITWDGASGAILTVGGSLMAGRLDPDLKRKYFVAGADLYARVAIVDLHAEYLLRRTEMSLGEDPDARFRYGPGGNGAYDDFFLKDGFYVEADFLVSKRLELLARVDGLRRFGNVPVDSPLRKRSQILRYTAGLNLVLDPLRVKLDGELYDFSDFDDEVAVNAGIVASF